MYSLILLLSNYTDHLHVFVSLVVSCVLATSLFYLLVAPLHNLLKAYVAYNQGDVKVKDRGHLKFLPKKSFNWIGFVSSLVLFLPIVHPVYYRKHRFYNEVKGTVAVALTGNLFYFLSAIVFTLIYLFFKSLRIYGVATVTNSVVPLEFMPMLYHGFLSTMYFLSRICFFATFINLLPVIPMDCGEILGLVLRINWVDALKNNEVLVSFLIFLGSFFSVARPRGWFSLMTTDVINFFDLLF